MTDRPLGISSPESAARFVREQLPRDGLFADQDWRISPTPFPIGAELAQELDSLGRVLLQFYRAINLLYRQSVAGKQPSWVAAILDQGKPQELIDLQRSAAFKSDIPRVIRPDVLLTDTGFTISELDSVPGGIGMTAWLNQIALALGKGLELCPVGQVQIGDGGVRRHRSRVNDPGVGRILQEALEEGFAKLLAPERAQVAVPKQAEHHLLLEDGLRRRGKKDLLLLGARE